jgi:plasmid stabilization system protein ParE
MAILVRPAAAADMDDAFVWYEGRRAGLGVEFLDAVDRALEAISAQPARNPVIYRNTRRILLRRFPYAIYYRILNGDVVVVACMHGRRSPRRWRGR